jgi:hypothetical protein
MSFERDSTAAFGSYTNFEDRPCDHMVLASKKLPSLTIN